MGDLKFEPGDRVELVSCTDEHTDLRPGAQGTVSELGLQEVLGTPTLNVRWDSGSNLSMLLALGDAVRKL